LLQSVCSNSWSCHQSQCDLGISPPGGFTTERMLRLFCCLFLFIC
jgi:hypothetical protein